MGDAIDKEIPAGSLPIRFETPASIETRYVTNFVAQHTDQEFIIGFYEARPPMLLGSPEENRAELEELGAVSAQCVARIVLTPARMVELIQVLSTNYDSFSANQAREGK